MSNEPFQHRLFWKYCVVFGTLFNDITIWRGKKEQKFKVPIEFAPREKMLAMVMAKPDDKSRAIQLPRMSFECTGISFDPSRKIERRHAIEVGNKVVLRGAPYNINFQLNIMSKNMLDATSIVEQILIMFQPDYTVDVRLIENFDHIDRIAIDIDSVSNEDAFSDDFHSMRRTVWTIDFVMYGWFYGNVEQQKQIKRVDIQYRPMDDQDAAKKTTMIIPGLTEDGKPTTDPKQTIPYININEGDNYDIIIERDYENK